MKTKRYDVTRREADIRLECIINQLEQIVTTICDLRNEITSYEEVYRDEPNELDVWPSTDDAYEVETTSFRDPYFRYDRGY